jgi:hypothetical protein
LSPGEGGSCSSETKHNRRTAPRPKLFVSERRLQKQRHQTRKIVLGSSPGEDGFYSLETKHDKRTAPGPKLFVSARRLQEQRPQSQKTVPGPIEGGFKPKHNRRTAPRPKLFRRGDNRKKGYNPEKLPWIRIPVKMVAVVQKLSR